MTTPRDGKRPIDRLREGAGSVEITTPGDDSAVVGLIPFDEKMLVVKGGGIYRVMLADQIDPGRTNLHTPNTVQRILPYGADAEWVGASVLTAHYFLKGPCPPRGVDCDAAFQHMLSFAVELAGAHDIANVMRDAEQAALASTSAGAKADRSMILPSLGNVGPRCKEFLQRADHALQSLFDLAKLFHPSLGPGGWPGLTTITATEPEEIDNFKSFLAEMVPVMQMIRNARNCSEHPRPEQRLELTDFRLDEMNTLHLPGIAVVHPQTPVAAASTRTFFQQVLADVAHVGELLPVFLCARKAAPIGGMPVHVIELPPERRKYRHARYAYGAVLDGRTAQVG